MSWGSFKGDFAGLGDVIVCVDNRWEAGCRAVALYEALAAFLCAEHRPVRLWTFLLWWKHFFGLTSIHFSEFRYNVCKATL